MTVPSEVEREAIATVRNATPWARTSELEVLKSKKSFVYRFRGDPSGPAVVAKLARSDTLQVEHCIYQDLLSSAPVSAPQCFGFVQSQRTGYAWLLIEDADGVPFDPSVPDHRVALGRWLGELHVWARTAPGLASLPDRGPTYHRAILNEVEEAVTAARMNASVTEEDAAMLDHLAAQCREIRERWSDLTDLLECLPSTIVHNGIAGKNVQLRRSDSSDALEVMAFDWEAGGRGHPAADLSMVDGTSYHDAVRPFWPDLDADTMGALAQLGRVLWNTAPIPGERASLVSTWPHRALHKLRFYDQQITEALEGLDGRGAR